MQTSRIHCFTIETANSRKWGGNETNAKDVEKRKKHIKHKMVEIEI
jgi:hypothetical protein